MNAKMQSSGVDRAREMSVFAAVAAGGAHGLARAGVDQPIADVVLRVGAEAIEAVPRHDAPEPLAFRRQRVQGPVFSPKTEDRAATYAEAIVEMGRLAADGAGEELHVIPG